MADLKDAKGEQNGYSKQDIMEKSYDSDIPSLSEEAQQIDEKKLMRKIDWKLIPWLSLLYLVSFLDVREQETYTNGAIWLIKQANQHRQCQTLRPRG